MIKTKSAVNPEGKPFVIVAWGDESGQLDPDEARRFGLSMIETAEAAESDAMFFWFCREKLGMSLEKTAHALKQWRYARLREEER